MKGEISIIRVKQYNSLYRHVVSKNGVPLFITQSRKRAELLSALLNGFGSIDDVSDGKIKKIIKKELIT
jgi:hypothetical protein